MSATDLSLRALRAGLALQAQIRPDDERIAMRLLVGTVDASLDPALLSLS